MKIKKFKAKTFGQALDMVKKELSEDAVILATEEGRGIRPFVEVTAAIDYDEVPDKARDVHHTVEPASTARIPAATGHDNTSTEEALVHDLRNEIRQLRQSIESMKKTGYEMSLPPRKRSAVQLLRECGVRDEYAVRLCENLKSVEDIPLLIAADIKVRRAASSKKAVMLIGPTGVGKTTTIAKLAANAVKSGKKCAVISLDTYRIGAAEQVRIYARILGIPLAITSNHEELRTNLIKFAESKDVIFIDTTGRNPADAGYIAEIERACSVDIPLELHLLQSANADDAFLIEAYRYYCRLPIDYLTFTKLDEAVKYGALYNLVLTYQKPVSYLTTGQRVPGDIELASVNRLAALIIGGRTNTM